MTCAPQFPPKFDFACIIQFLMKARSVKETGVSMALVSEGLWLTGCVVASFDPVGVTLGNDLAIDTTEDSVFAALNEVDRLDALVAEGLKFFDADDEEQHALTVQAFRDDPKAKDWTVFIPIMLEIVKMILENRRKKTTPTEVGTPLDPQVVTQRVPVFGSIVQKH